VSASAPAPPGGAAPPGPGERSSTPTDQAGRVRLLDVDEELAAAVPAHDRGRARRALVVPVHAVDRGVVDLGRLPMDDTTFVLLLLEGTLSRDVVLADHELSELLVPGDLLSPWEPAADGIPSVRRLTALDQARLTVLDGRFMRAAAVWPGLMTAVHRRLNDQEHRVATHGVICQLPRVEQRILAVMWHVAMRTGKVGTEGTVVPVRLTHRALGRLVGARRPTVTLALKHLAATGRLARRRDGSWVLPRGVDVAELTDGSAGIEPSRR
jgi:CRP/FNR family transcriptional regulator, cyclic AMP receptor protein